MKLMLTHRYLLAVSMNKLKVMERYLGQIYIWECVCIIEIVVSTQREPVWDQISAQFNEMMGLLNF
jgi:hypothetical protein